MAFGQQPEGKKYADVQPTPKDYFNREVQLGQGETTHKFLNLLEEGNLDSIYMYVDSSLFISDTSAKTKILTAIKEIRKYKNSTERSEGLIVYEDNHNVYRCGYYKINVGGEFEIDIHYAIGNPKSKVVAIKIRLSDQLEKERIESKEYFKQHQGPPPPPKPDLVH